MDFNSKKILKLLCENKNKHYNFFTIAEQFPELSKRSIIEIVHSLYNNGYIIYVSDSSFKVTNKGETYFRCVRSKWISENIVSILALIVSILAFIEATISLIISK